MTLFSLAPKIASHSRFYSCLQVPAPFQLANTPSCGVSGVPSRTRARPMSGSLAAARQAYARRLALCLGFQHKSCSCGSPSRISELGAGEARTMSYGSRTWRRSTAACLVVENVTGALRALLIGPQNEEGAYIVDLWLLALKLRPPRTCQVHHEAASLGR